MSVQQTSEQGTYTAYMHDDSATNEDIMPETAATQRMEEKVALIDQSLTQTRKILEQVVDQVAKVSEQQTQLALKGQLDNLQLSHIDRRVNVIEATTGTLPDRLDSMRREFDTRLDSYAKEVRDTKLSLPETYVPRREHSDRWEQEAQKFAETSARTGQIEQRVIQMRDEITSMHLQMTREIADSQNKLIERIAAQQTEYLEKQSAQQKDILDRLAAAATVGTTRAVTTQQYIISVLVSLVLSFLLSYLAFHH